MKLSRRQFLARVGASVAVAGAGGAAYVGWWEPRHVQLTHHRVTVPGLPQAWDNLTIAHLTDLHRSRYVTRDYLAGGVARVNALEPDLVLFTGDYLTHGHTTRGRVAYGDETDAEALVTDCAAVIAQAKARFGVWASLGNHDHWFNAGIVTRVLEDAGIPVLRNNSVTVRIGGEALPVVGLGDLWTEGADFDRAFAGVAAPFAVVLMHNPDSFETWPRPGAHLILAGHTHGGQVNVPFLGPPVVPSRYGTKYASGWFRRGAAQMYVSRGIGLIAPPVRFNCPPEIPIYHLQSA